MKMLENGAINRRRKRKGEGSILNREEKGKGVGLYNTLIWRKSVSLSVNKQTRLDTILSDHESNVKKAFCIYPLWFKCLHWFNLGNGVVILRDKFSMLSILDKINIGYSSDGSTVD